MDAKTLSSPKTSDFVKDGRGHISNVHSERQQDSRTRHAMLQQLLNVKKSDLENSMEKKQKAMEYVMDNPVENRRMSMDNFIVDLPNFEENCCELSGLPPPESEKSIGSSTRTLSINFCLLSVKFSIVFSTDFCFLSREYESTRTSDKCIYIVTSYIASNVTSETK
jgi:hypothetical protein